MRAMAYIKENMQTHRIVKWLTINILIGLLPALIYLLFIIIDVPFELLSVFTNILFFAFLTCISTFNDIVEYRSNGEHVLREIDKWYYLFLLLIPSVLLIHVVFLVGARSDLGMIQSSVIISISICTTALTVIAGFFAQCNINCIARTTA